MPILTVPTLPAALPPSGAAGGDLSGTYPNPTIAAGAVVLADLATATVDAIVPWRAEVPVWKPSALVGTQVFSANPAQWGGGVWYSGSGAQNDAWTWSGVTLAAGTWEILLLTSTDTNRAIQTYKLDGASVGTIDCYSGAEVDNTVKSITGITVATTGVHSLQVVAATRNAAATNWFIVIQELVLHRTA